MKSIFFVSSIALLRASSAFAQSTTDTAEASRCTASLITTLCDYKEPGAYGAVASSGKSHCWEYCDSHQPCSFVLFAAGNPHTGTGTCWLYPGEEYDESLGDTDCGNHWLSVYDKPVCDPDPTATAEPCEATETPSAFDEVCGYPAPDTCFNDCVASNSASQCLSFCAEAESCAYAIYNPRNDDLSPHAPGTCWIYPEGEYDTELASACSGATEQYVYENACPKPEPTTTSPTSPPSSTSSSADGDESTGAESTDAETEEGILDSADRVKGGDDEDSSSASFSCQLLFALSMGMLVL